MWVLKWVFIALIIILILGASLQNSAQVTIRILNWKSGQIPMYMVIYCAFAVGMLVFLPAAAFYQMRNSAEIRKGKREIKRLEEELANRQTENRSTAAPPHSSTT